MERITLIDGDSIIWLAGHSYKDTEQKSLKDMLDSCDYIVKDILDQCKADYYSAFLTDGSFRYKIAKLKPYKGNRRNIPKPKFFNTLKGYLIEQYGFQSRKDYEADDLVIMAQNTFYNTKQYEPIIASPDKDLRQVSGLFYDYKKKELTEVTSAEATNNFWMQMLTGDTGDNIPGLAGIGPSKAPNILGDKNYHSNVLNAYISLYGENTGIRNFYENYDLLKLHNTLDNELYYPVIINKNDVIKSGIEDLW